MNVTCFKCQKKRHYVNNYNDEKVPKKVSENSKTSLLAEIYEMKQLQVMSLSKRILVKEGSFEGKFTLTSLHKKFIYLSFKIEGIEVSMLINTWTTNPFISPTCTKKLKLSQEQTKEMKVSFVYGKELIYLVVKDVKFKYENIRF